MKLSVELEPALTPFKLLAAERAWNGDDWAWKFLRLNPRYRHDVKLAARAEYFRAASRRPSIEHFLRTPEGARLGREALLAEDSRLFVGDHVLDSGSCWPTYRPETLGLHLQRTHGTADLSSVRFREFDAARDYGISEWLDPDHPTLPTARGSLSWFHWMTDPVWECAHENFVPTETVGTPVTDIRVRRRDIRLIRAPATTNPSRQGTWLAFAINVSLFLSPQLTGARQIADLYQDTLSQQHANRLRTPKIPAGYEPLIWDWHRQVRPLPKLDAAVDDLLRSQVTPQSWMVVLLDVRFDLSAQFEQVEGQLAKHQNLRERAGNKAFKDFWLKRLLVLAELQVLNIEGLRSANEIERALFDVGSPEWRTFWAAQLGKVPDAPRLEVSRYDAVKSSLPEARAMVEQGYGFLVGRQQANLYPRGD